MSITLFYIEINNKLRKAEVSFSFSLSVKTQRNTESAKRLSD